MRRRNYLVACVGTTAAGCASNTDSDGGNGNSNESDGNDSGSEDGDTASKIATRSLIDETIYTKQRIPFKMSEGDVLHISVDLERGRICLVDVANVTEGESIFVGKVRTEDEFEIDATGDGEYLLTFQAHDRAAVSAVVEETE
ncbi:hypothetical protein [Natrinema caseinilyticum]|uniref:hypothetical protein n=1 Tax=Natrinema caseinilyticum TaxID=2961570 RepID=UPI0020C332FD|nr:hypothetical protein [Natrinema caseinilyticum]